MTKKKVGNGNRDNKPEQPRSVTGKLDIAFTWRDKLAILFGGHAVVDLTMICERDPVNVQIQARANVQASPTKVQK